MIYLPSSSNDKGDLGLSVNVEVSGLLGGALGINNILVGLSVFCGVLDSVGCGDGAGSSACLLLSGASVSELFHELGISLLLLEDVLGNGGFGGGGGFLCPKT